MESNPAVNEPAPGREEVTNGLKDVADRTKTTMQDNLDLVSGSQYYSISTYRKQIQVWDALSPFT